VIVGVTAAGTWSTRQVTVRSTLRGHRFTAAQAMFGFGIRLAG
jgi:hypothetical protein